jgi:hypothetical protein
MKVTLLALLALSTHASACASYNNCHCYDSDGKPNNGATQTLCNHYKGSMVPDESENGEGTSYMECEAQTFGGASSFENCDWRIRCQSAGATGNDSSCRLKNP